MDGNYLIVTCSLHDQGNVINAHALIDWGASGLTCREKDNTHYHHLPLLLLMSYRNLTVIDKRPITWGAITHITHPCLVIQNLSDDIPLLVTK
jgi:hypothetical protein